MAVKLAGLSPKDALEQRGDLITNAQALVTDHADDWGDDHEQQYNAMLDDASKLKQHADRVSNLAQLESESAANPLPNPHETPGDHQKPAKVTLLIRQGNQYVEVPADRARASQDYQDKFETFLRTRYARTGLHEAQVDQSGAGSPMMALQSDVADQAGYLLTSEQFAAGILKEVDDMTFVRRYARIHTVPEAHSLGIRARTARASTFGWSQELTISTSDSALKYGKRSLTPHHLTGAIELSRDLVRRSAGTVESEIRYELGRDAAEVMEDAYLTGNGAQQPLGVFTASSDGISTSRDSSSGSATSITADALLNAKYALKSQYRNGGERGGARWLFHRDGIKIIAKLKDSDNQYLFRVGMGRAQDTGLPEDQILSMPVDESERSPNTFTTGLYVGLLANWRYYEIADALDMEIQVLVELKAATNQFQYIARIKTDGMPTLEEAFVRLKTD